MASAEDFDALDRATQDDEVALALNPGTRVFHELTCGKAKAAFQRIARELAEANGFRPARCCHGGPA